MPALALVFIEQMHILPDNVDTITESDLKNSQAPVEATNAAEAEQLIAVLYEKNMPSKKEKLISVYHKLDSAIVWYVNTISCCRRLLLACFMCKLIFKPKAIKYCYNNCLYEEEEKSAVGIEIQKILLRSSIRYWKTDEWHQIWQNLERKQLQTRSDPIAAVKITTKQVDACNSILDKFAKGVWSEDKEDSLYFPI